MRFLTVGPTQLFDSVPSYIEEALKNNICSISHRSKDFENIFRATTSALKELMDIPEDYHIFFLSSATESMERIIENLVDEKSFHFVNGAFSNRFFTIAQESGKKPEKIEVDFGEGFDFNNLRLPENTDLICFTHNETSTGVMIDLKDIYKFKEQNPDSLVAVDIVSSAPYCNIDFRKIDAAFFSVQKGFGLPAGLGVLIVNDSCIERSKQLRKKQSIGSYHNFLTLLQKSEKNQTPETPNVLGIYLLGKIAEELNRYGIDNIRKETQQRADILYSFFENNDNYEIFVKEKKIRSSTVIVINALDGSEKIINKLRQNNYLIGAGYNNFKKTQIRISNYPMVTMHDVKEIIKHF